MYSQSGGCGGSPSCHACWCLWGKMGRDTERRSAESLNFRYNHSLNDKPLNPPKENKNTGMYQLFLMAPLTPTYACGWRGGSGGTCPSRCTGDRWKVPADACCALCRSPPSLHGWCRSEASMCPSARDTVTSSVGTQRGWWCCNTNSWGDWHLWKFSRVTFNAGKL